MRSRMGRVPWLLVACGVLLSACAKFDDRVDGQIYLPAPTLSAPAGPQPELPEVDGNSDTVVPGPSESHTPVPPPQGCTDYDRSVIATCLDTVSVVAVSSKKASSPNALAAERKTGRVLQVGPDGKQSQLAKLTVDAGGDGGLTGLALSPTYNEDQLVFAYITTATDNRVVRFTRGQQPKAILTGIPKGATGDRGALLSDGNALLVATGDAGNPAAAADPKSLAGKVLRIDASGNPAPGNPTPGARLFAAGLHSPGGLCSSADGSRLWVTDRGPGRDVLYRVPPGGALTVPAWTWPDRPGVAGCVDGEQVIGVTMSIAGGLQDLPIAADGSISGTPQTVLDGKNGVGYGRLGGLDLIDSQYALAGTVNRDGGQPVSSDDRVVLIQVQPSSGGGAGKD